MANTMLSCPVLDMLTNDELHRALLRAVLVRQKVPDPDTLLAENSIESQVMYREIRMPDGNMTMMASIAITRVVSHQPVASHQTQAVQPGDSQPKSE